jgi:pSer/pThr/pTyr-binding forkhead associated (FHA) protein
MAMATQVPSLTIVAGTGGAVDLAVDITSGFDQVLGRDAAADITLPDPAISRRHARLYRATDGVWLEDLGSTNGTYINGDRLTVPYRLRDGDEVQLGNSVATFHEVANEADATQVITTLDSAAERQETVPAPAKVQQAAAATDPIPAAVQQTQPTDPVPAAVQQAAPVVAVAAQQPVANRAERADTAQSVCPDCSATNRSEAWFCSQCGRQLRSIPFLAGDQPGPGIASRSPGLKTAHGEVRRQEFRQAMRARNGGRRVPYNESLAVPTIAFRSLLAVFLLAVAVFGLVILNEGVHRVFGL